MKNYKFLTNGKEVDIELGTKIDRKSLYGEQKITVEDNEVPLEKVLVTAEGEILREKDTYLARVDQAGSTKIAGQVTDEGNTPEIWKSSENEVRDLVPIKPWEVANFCASGVRSAKTSGLEKGFYKTVFALRDSPAPEDAILAVGEESFLLTGEFRDSAMTTRLETYEFFDSGDETEEEEENDFAMF